MVIKLETQRIYSKNMPTTIKVPGFPQFCDSIDICVIWDVIQNKRLGSEFLQSYTMSTKINETNRLSSSYVTSGYGQILEFFTICSKSRKQDALKWLGFSNIFQIRLRAICSYSELHPVHASIVRSSLYRTICSWSIHTWYAMAQSN